MTRQRLAGTKIVVAQKKRWAKGEEISGKPDDQDRSGLAAFFEAMHIAAPFGWASGGYEILRWRGGSLSPGKMGRSVLRPYKGGRPD